MDVFPPKLHSKNAGLFFKSKCWVKPVGSLYWVVFNIFTQMLGNFFNPNAWFNLLGHLLGYLKIKCTQVLGSCSVTKLLGYF